MNVSEGIDATGIVMRFEGGGSIGSLLYGSGKDKGTRIPIEEKLRLLKGSSFVFNVLNYIINLDRNCERAC
jgi:hypothetical protein